MKGEGTYSHIYERRIALIRFDPIAAVRRAAQRWNIQVALGELGPRSRRLLDIGCGSGQFLVLAQQRGHQVAGIDFNPDSLGVAREVFGLKELFCGSLEQFLQSNPPRFEAVTALEVLEHTEQPIDFLRQVVNLLAPGGSLYLSVPGLERWPKIFDPETDYPPHHLTLWTEPALVRAFERVGLHCTRIIHSPLRADDFLRNLNLRLQRRVFRRQAARTEGEKSVPSESRATKLAWKVYARLAGTMARELLRVSFHLPAALLRLYPHAGGFGLFAVGVKRKTS